MCNHPTTELISISKCMYGGYEVAVLINDDYFVRLHYYGYAKSEAKRLAKIEAMNIAKQDFQFYLQEA